MAKEVENIAKIRELLFGNNLTELELRFNKSEAFLQSEISNQNENYNKRIEALKTNTEESAEYLKNLLQSEKNNRENALLKIQEDLQSLKTFSTGMEERLTTELNTLKQWMTDQQQSNEKQIKKITDELKAHFNDQLNDIRQSKVERSALAVLFSDLAMQMVQKEDTQIDEKSVDTESN